MQAPYSNSPANAKVGAQSPQARHGGRLLAVARERGVQPHEILDFSNNTNILAETLTEKVVAGLDIGFRHYPETGAPALTAALAAHEGVPASHILPTHGASEAILVILSRL
ncbi:MAG: aminotransferase class I/II, partial [Oceanidesulfovibrio sp.]